MNVILEIGGGTGGDEAAIFAGDLFRMYQRFAESRNWNLTVLDPHRRLIGRIQRDCELRVRRRCLRRPQV